MGYENGPASFKTSFGSFIIMCVPSLYLPSKLFNLLTSIDIWSSGGNSISFLFWSPSISFLFSFRKKKRWETGIRRIRFRIGNLHRDSRWPDVLQDALHAILTTCSNLQEKNHVVYTVYVYTVSYFHSRTFFLHSRTLPNSFIQTFLFTLFERFLNTFFHSRTSERPKCPERKKPLRCSFVHTNPQNRSFLGLELKVPVLGSSTYISYI